MVGSAQSFAVFSTRQAAGVDVKDTHGTSNPNSASAGRAFRGPNANSMRRSDCVLGDEPLALCDGGIVKRTSALCDAGGDTHKRPWASTLHVTPALPAFRKPGHYNDSLPRTLPWAGATRGPTHPT